MNGFDGKELLVKSIVKLWKDNTKNLICYDKSISGVILK